jgi:hypothetical protein
MKRGIAAGLFGAAVIALAAYHWLQFFWVMSDENEHLYVARQVASGVSLYGGIHSARPPMFFVPLVALLRLGIPPLLVGRLCAFLAVVASAAVLWWIGWRLWGLWSGLAGAVLFLLSPDVASLFSFMGIQQTALLALLCLALRLQGAPVWAGVVGGLALATGQHSAIIVAAAALYQVRSKPRSVGLFILSALGVLGLTVALCVAAGGTGMWNDLVANHLYHLGGARSEQQVQAFSGRLAEWLSANAGILVLAATGTVAGLRDPRVRFWSAVTALHVLAVVGMNFGQVMYLFPASVLLAALAGYGLQRVLSRLKVWSPSAGWRWPSSRSVLTLGVYVLVTVGGTWGAMQLCDEHYGGDLSFWPHRRELELSRGSSAEPAARVAQAVRRLSMAGGSLFGGPPELVSYLALESGARIAGQLADLAPQWIINGTVPRSSVISQIERDQVNSFVSLEGGFYVHDRGFQNYLLKCYADPIEFPPMPGSLMNTLFLFVHKDERPCQ